MPIVHEDAVGRDWRGGVSDVPVYRAVADACIAEGATAVFGVVGNNNMHWATEMAQRPEVSFVHARHEQGAVAMADGFARCSPACGVATVTSGPGLTQTATALTVAVRHGTPMVLVAGDTPVAETHALQHMDQRRFVESTGAGFVGVRSAEGAVADVQAAFYGAMSERRPYVLGLPGDIQMRHTAQVPYQAARTLLPATEATRPVPEAVAQAAELIARSRRPLVLAGRGVHASGAHDVVAELADRLAAPLCTTLRAKGLFDTHPRALGIAGGLGSLQARQLVVESDLVIAVGARLGHHTTDGGRLFPDAPVVTVNRASVGLSEGVALPGVHVLGDARETVAALLSELADHPQRQPWAPNRTSQAADDAAMPSPSDGVDPRQLMERVDSLVGPESHVVVGIGHFFFFAVTHLRRAFPDAVTLAYDFGAIGQALPTGIGIALARPGGRVCVIEGDGSLMMQIEELDTLARYGLPVLVVVVNDGGYGAEFHKLEALGIPDAIVRHGHVDFAATAIALGCRGATVTDLAQLPALFEAHLAAGAPEVWDVRVSPSVLADYYRRRNPARKR